MSWFESWFDSPYYHILYQNRNELEAEAFLDKLLTCLKPALHSTMLDLGCGKGRHAVYLNEKGYQVTGIDLSEQSILHCLQFENKELSFYVHDMRKLFRVNDFDYVLNLFTSFGFFEKETENIAAIKNACKAVKKGGTLVLDYLNSVYVESHLVENDIVVADQITFKIHRKIKNNYFHKIIDFTDKGKDYQFTEKVAGLKLSDFQKYLEPCNMKITQIFGDYDLHPFDVIKSPRLIIIATKE